MTLGTGTLGTGRLRLLLLGTTLAMTAVDVAVDLAWAAAPAGVWVIDLGIVLAWSLIGAVAWRRRPGNRVGLLMMVFGLLMAVEHSAFGLHSSSRTAAALVTVAVLLNSLELPLAAQIMLAYPSGRLSDRLSRWLLAAGYVYAVADGVRRALMVTYGRGQAGTWAQSVLRVTTDVAVQRAYGAAAAVVWLILAVAFVVLLARRVARASRRERRVLAFPFSAVAATVATLVVLTVWGAGHTVGMWSVQEPHWLASVLGIVATVGVPVAFLVGLLRERLTYASVAGLVRSMDRLPVEQIEPTLARVLRDPSLRLMFAVDDGYLDPLGRAVSPPASGAGSVTVLGDADAPVAVLVHDPALNDEPELLQGAAAAIRLALENARLHAEVKDQLAQVRASRARLVGAADAARRRLERDLHDGAQQRLVTAGLALQLLRRRLPGPSPAADAAQDDNAPDDNAPDDNAPDDNARNDNAQDDNAQDDNARNDNAQDDDARELLAEAEAELRQAIVELRELARGIHPAILTDQGLRAAVDQLALRCPVPITVTGDPGRAPTEVESTAYFVVSEALTNAIRHAQAGRVTIDLVRAEDRLAVTVTDDGIGGADPAAGSGLTGLADRVASIDGHLTIASQPNAGTQLHVELPCA